MPAPHIVKTRIENRLPVAREGIPFFIIGLAVTLAFYFFGLIIPAVIMGFMTLFTLNFFRDPERGNDAASDAVLSPADGRILNILNLEGGDNPLGEPAKKVSVFMNVFNVHVNRIPLSGRILKITYNPGKFFSADLDKASEQNENTKILLEADNGQRILFSQIAGLIARRIVCWVEENDQVQTGQRFGLIRFGSRLDIYLPYNSKIAVMPGQKVKAGVTVLGYLT
jgi:phosphatidylserine decarboxylase